MPLAPASVAPAALQPETPVTDRSRVATQNIVDPRRRGKQASGFSDDDISDIVCVLHPHSNNARREISRIANEDCPHIFGRDEVDNVDTDFSLEDKASRFEMAPPGLGSYVIVLRLSAAMKDPNLGFTFGRNAPRCDICFSHDPSRRLSNVHFRIFVNTFGVVMLEDQSTNGTIVDTHLLKSKTRPPVETQRMLTSGSRVKILMHQEDLDLVFMVRIPRREGAYDKAYRDRLNDYFVRLDALRNKQARGTTITPGPAGPPNLFAAPNGQPVAKRTPLTARGSATPPVSHRARNTIPMEWDGSDKYNRVGVIGRGAFAIVYQVTSKSDGSPYAAKELEKRHFMKNGVLDQKVENEMNIMKGLQHVWTLTSLSPPIFPYRAILTLAQPNIVQFIEHFDWDDRQLIIIMEFVPGGDLGKLIHTHGPLPETVVQAMADQLLDAFEYMHERGITHRDVKPDNILISSTDPFEVKLTDFGLSKMVNNEETFLRTFCGTLLYCAPEVYIEFSEYDHLGRRNPRLRGRRPMVGQRYDHAVDVWSLGGVIFFTLTGKPPYPVQSGVSHSELLNRIMTTDLDIGPLQRAGVSRDGIDFLRLMLQRRPELRSTVRELRGHPWLGGPRLAVDPAESLDEVTDDDLPAHASQLSLEEGRSGQGQARPDSEVLVNHDDFDGLSDTSQKENYSGEHQRANNQPALFGEVNLSAIGSSGSIPEHRLNLRVTAASDSAAETVILDSQNPDGFDDSDHFTPHKRSQPKEGAHLSVGPHNQSADQLQSLVADVQSQSLGRIDSMVGGGSGLSRGNGTLSSSGSRVLAQPSEFTASKRKPNYDSSDEFGGGSVHGRPSFKRLKSDLEESLTDEVLEEYKLIASIPPVQRLESGRQIDRPVHKSIFWNHKDARSYHLKYPEMTQLQLDVFVQAARAHGQRFEPSDSPLWAIAMKYFPPTDWSAVDDSKENDPPRRVSTPQTMPFRRDSGRLGEVTDLEIPSTAPVPLPASSSDDSIPDTAPQDGNIVVPIREGPSQNRIVGLLESSPGSAIPNISIPISRPMLSWGRGVENTHVYEDRAEARVPKYAFKILLYKDGFDASKDRNPQPWLRSTTGADEDAYAFYVCTKATSGIFVNGHRLPSHEPKRPSSPAHYWMRLHTSDELVVWGDPSEPKPETRLRFNAFWGGSAADRTEEPAPVPSGLARRLDEVCLRAERRSRSEEEYRAAMNTAVSEHGLREKFVERERAMSREFEEVRRDAVEMLSMLRRSPAGRA